MRKVRRGQHKMTSTLFFLLAVYIIGVLMLSVMLLDLCVWVLAMKMTLRIAIQLLIVAYR